MNHVDAQHRVRGLQGPRKPGDIKVNGEIDVREPFLFDASGNGPAELCVWIGRLPGEAWERLGEMNDVLSRAAGNLQHNSALGQNARKDIKYWAFVAFRRRN